MTTSVKAAKVRQTLVKETAQPSISIAEERRSWHEAAPLPDGFLYQNKTIGDELCLHLSSQMGAKSLLILYLHGGGLAAGNPHTHERNIGKTYKSKNKRHHPGCLFAAEKN